MGQQKSANIELCVTLSKFFEFKDLDRDCLFWRGAADTAATTEEAGRKKSDRLVL